MQDLFLDMFSFIETDGVQILCDFFGHNISYNSTVQRLYHAIVF